MYFCHEPKSLFSILEGKMRERERERLGDRERENCGFLSQLSTKYPNYTVPLRMFLMSNFIFLTISPLILF